ncbi:MAG: peptide/nickel transport system substrate-binding protein [Thermomicrobiales bacterium]|nr:peptide/nickel transport system substrate-binding protein [Thermomicrobiales bacterium]MEA2525520.1 peptide/nickel transport system substrate-binding protein [Thermomicrobiales bacterium]MEA2596866.1 peptide/nickel transport system substrate-binding protein [Thermomicrobiales bacterium]
MASDHRARISRRSVLKAAGAAPLVAGGLAAPHRAAALQTEEPVRGGTFTYGNSKPAQNVISPLNTIGTGQNVLIEALFLRLVNGRQWGDGVNPDPSQPLDLAVAETMTEVEKDRVWDFTIRKNVLWHDGQPVTPDDVIFGIWLSLNKNAKAVNETPVVKIKGGERLLTEGAAVGQVEVEGATKINDNTVRIELTEPVPNYWVNWTVGYWPMPKHIFGEMPFEELFNEPYATMPIGNGPFKAVKFVDGQYMEFAANEDFYLGRPNVDKYIVRFGDSDTLTAALEAQEIDGMGVSAGPVYDRLTGLDFLTGNPVPRDHPDGFGINFGRFPDQAAELHKALQHAIDVETLSAQLYSGTLRPSTDLFQHIVGFEQSPEGFENRTYDPDKAKAILEQIGWDANRELEWLVWSPPTAAQDAMQAMLAAVGIKTKYQVIDVATITDEAYRNYAYDIWFTNFGASQFIEDNWKYFKCGWTYDTGGFNAAQYCNAEVDALIQQGLDTTDAAERKALIDQANLKLNASPPQATIFRQSITYVWNKRVRGAYPYQYRLPVRPALERVWIAQ